MNMCEVFVFGRVTHERERAAQHPADHDQLPGAVTQFSYIFPDPRHALRNAENKAISVTRTDAEGHCQAREGAVVDPRTRMVVHRAPAVARQPGGYHIRQLVDQADASK